MTNYEIKKGDTLWAICKREFNLTNDTDIANAVNRVAKANNIANADSIFAGDRLNLHIEQQTQKETNEVMTNPKDSVPTEEADNSPEQTIAPTEQLQPEPSDLFDKWVADCAKKMGNGEEQTEVFDFVGDDYKTAIRNKDMNTAVAEYNKKIMKLSESILKATDKNEDGKINADEQFSKDVADYEKAFGEKLNNSDSNTIKNISNTFVNRLDIDKSGSVDSKEYAAYIALTDSQNTKGNLDGKITNSENVTMQEKAICGNENEFGKSLKDMHKFLFGK